MDRTRRLSPRILAGRFARRVLVAPTGRTTRPTASRTREALFNILTHHAWPAGWRLAGTDVLDACCGTGALGLEALSRGAGRLWLMDNDANARAAATANIAQLNIQNVCHVLAVDARQPPRAAVACGLILLDPPYGQNLPAAIVTALLQAGWIGNPALVVVETGSNEPAPVLPSNLPLLFARNYGAARLSFAMNTDYIKL